jgi:hypothetical protein
MALSDRRIAEVVCILLAFVCGCKHEIIGTAAIPRQSASETQWKSRIEVLEDIYRRQGIERFLEAKAVLVADATRLDENSSAFFEVQYCFVDPNIWSWKDDLSEDARLTQSMIRTIEANPGRSLKESDKLRQDIFVGWTGSGNPCLTPVLEAVLELYKVVATEGEVRGRSGDARLISRGRGTY